MKRFILILITILLWIDGKTQQLPIYSQYTENLFLINPAVAGNEDRTIYTLANRLQWLGSRDAPNTQSLSGQWRMKQAKKFKFLKKMNSGKKSSVGLGANLFNDKNVLLQRTGASIAYAYHIHLRGSSKLSFGLSLSTFQLRLDKNNIIIKDPSDPILYSSSMKTSFVVDASVGAFLTDRNYFVGISAMQLSQSFLNLGNTAFDNYQLRRHYYLVGGYYFELNNEYTIVPSALLRTTEQIKRFQADFTCKVIYMERFWFGMSYRSNNDIVGIIGLNHNKLYLTYTLDFPLNPMLQHSNGSHELTMSFKLGRPQKNRGTVR